MLENYLEEQEVVTKLLLDSFKKETLVQAYLFVSSDLEYLNKYALDFSKKLITENYNANICLKIDKNIYNELVVINPINNQIKKEQMLDLQDAFKTKAVEGKRKVYIINECDKLNLASANCVLKFLEEPQENIVAILLTCNINKVIPTIVSRCQVLNFKNTKVKNANFLNDLHDKYSKIYESEDASDENFKEYIEKIVTTVKNIEKEKLKFIIKYKNFFNLYKNKEDFVILFDFILFFYYDILNLKFDRKIKYMEDFKDLIYQVEKNNTRESIIEKIKTIQSTRLKLNTNMNLKLLLDDFLIKFNEV